MKLGYTLLLCAIVLAPRAAYPFADGFGWKLMVAAPGGYRIVG